MKLPDPPLLVVTDRGQALLPLMEIVRAAIAAGCRWIGVREKDLPVDEQIALAQRLRAAADGADVRLMLHGAIAFSDRSAQAIDGLHLPDQADVILSRPWRERQRLVGRSVHSLAQAGAANPDELDYVIAGPAYPSASKPGYGPPLGAAGIAEMVRVARVPVVAIGGVDRANADALMKAGAAGVAVMGGVMRSSDPGREVRALIAALHKARD